MSTKELEEIAEELTSLDYGELRIVVRGGEIVSFTTIKSRLKAGRHEINKKEKQSDQIQKKN